MHSCRYLDCHVMPDQEVALCSLSVKALWQLQKPDKRRKKNCDCIFAVILAMTSYVALQRLKVSLFFLLQFAIYSSLHLLLNCKKNGGIQKNKTHAAKKVLSVQQCCREILFKPQPDK